MSTESNKTQYQCSKCPSNNYTTEEIRATGSGFTRFMNMLFTPVVSLGEQLNVLFRAMASGERIFQALDWDEQVHEPEFPVKLPSRAQGSIEFRDLSFSKQKSGDFILKL